MAGPASVVEIAACAQQQCAPAPTTSGSHPAFCSSPCSFIDLNFHALRSSLSLAMRSPYHELVNREIYVLGDDQGRPQLRVFVADTEQGCKAGVKLLRASMADQCLAIDLEWTPDDARCESDVALIQLASPSVVLLVRFSHIGGLPSALRKLLGDAR